MMRGGTAYCFRKSRLIFLTSSPFGSGAAAHDPNSRPDRPVCLSTVCSIDRTVTGLNRDGSYTNTTISSWNGPNFRRFCVSRSVQENARVPARRKPRCAMAKFKALDSP
ncbi:hypothetical protein C8R47DRAFT_494400 [Mycena vitilis]|nr:hypothetical protein C8R47DRAFT_494400 [Mycena vitilis]